MSNKKSNENPDNDLVEIYRAGGEVEAQVIRSLLESCGIKALLSGEAVRFVYGFTLDGLAEVKIFVKQEDVKEALEIITAQQKNL